MLTIKALRARGVLAPLERPLRTASGEIPAAPLLLIDVETEEGITGSSYLFGYSPISLKPMAVLVGSIEELLAGKKAAPLDRMAELEAGFRLLGRQGLLGMVLSGIDMALWDALGKAHGVPVVLLLGGTPRPLPAYDSLSLLDPKADAGLVEASLKAGFRAIKIKTGDGDVARDVEVVSWLRDLVGPDIALMIDYNQSLTTVEALRRIDRLAEFDLAWVEEPVPAEDLKGHADIRAASPIPVQTGENWWFPQDMARAIAAEACDLAMPDLMKIGGITGWLRAAGQAEAASIPMSSHIFVEASAHVLPVTPTCHWLEYMDLARAVLVDPADLRDGKVTARGPGLGLTWNEKAVAANAL